MKAILLCLLLAGCASPSEKLPIQLCAIQFTQQFDQANFMVRLQCKPEGVAT